MNIDTNIKLTPDEQDLFSILKAVLAKNAPSTTLRCAGGWVRDKLLGVQSDDVDIMVDNMSGETFAKMVTAHIGGKDPSVIRENPDKSKHIETAKCYINLPSGKKQEVDFARARKEIYHEGSRIPSIEPATPQEDAMRRDLTINALFYNLNTGAVEDFTGKGIKDLISNTIQTPDEPNKTFLDDPLRIFRTIRFAAKYNGEIAPDTLAAMSNPGLRNAIKEKIAKERIGQEFIKMLKNKNADKAIEILKNLGLLQDILAEAIKGTPYEGAMSEFDMDQNNPNHKLSFWEHTFQVVKNTIELYKDADPEKRIVMILGALTHDFGKLYNKIQVKKGPSDKYPGHTGEYTTYKGHEDESSVIAELMLKYLKMDSYVQQVAGLAKFHMQPHSLERDQSSMNALRKFIRRIGEASLDWMDVFNLATADAYSKDKSISPEVVGRYKNLRVQLDAALQSLQAGGNTGLKPVVNGQEIMTALNLKPGPYMKEITEFVKELRDENPGISKEEAIAQIKSKYGHLSATAVPTHINPKKQQKPVKVDEQTPKQASKILLSNACPKHLLDKKAEVVEDLLTRKAYQQVMSEVSNLVKGYPEDDMVVRMACMYSFKSMLEDPKTRDNDLLQTVFERVENNFSDPVLNAYAMGILLLIDTPNDDDSIFKLGERSSKLSPEITKYVIETLPENKRSSNITKRIHEYIFTKQD